MHRFDTAVMKSVDVQPVYARAAVKRDDRIAEQPKQCVYAFVMTFNPAIACVEIGRSCGRRAVSPFNLEQGDTGLMISSSDSYSYRRRYTRRG